MVNFDSNGSGPARRSDGTGTNRPPHYSTARRDEVLAQEEVEVERKVFKIQRCRNNRGEFLRLIEERATGHSMVVIPETGFDAVLDAVERVLGND